MCTLFHKQLKLLTDLKNETTRCAVYKRKTPLGVVQTMDWKGMRLYIKSAQEAEAVVQMRDDEGKSNGRGEQNEKERYPQGLLNNQTFLFP